MKVYAGATLLSMMFCFISKHIGDSKDLTVIQTRALSSLFAFLSFVPLTYVSAVRYRVGTDFLSYTTIFRSGGFYAESGFDYFVRFIRKFSNDPQLLFVLTSVIICVGIYLLIYKESINPAYSVLLFVISYNYFKSLNVIRQFVALAIACQSIPAIRARQWKKCFFIVLVASLFHYSALFFIVFYFLYAVHIRPTSCYIVIVFLLVFGELFRRISLVVLEFLGVYAGFFFSARWNSDYTVWLNIAIYISFFLLLSFEYNYICNDENFQLLYLAVFLGTLISVSSIRMPFVVERLTLYTDLFLIVYLPEIIRKSGTKRIRMTLNTSVIAAYSIIFAIKIMYNIADVLPYQTYFS